MIPNSKKFGDKLTNLIDVWTKFAPETKFAGLGIAEFKTALARSIESRSQIHDMRTQIKGLIATRSAGDADGQGIVARVVHGILADADHGPNSAMYRALNYVPKSERASGLTLKTATAAAVPTSTTVTSTPSVAPSTK